jgi:hypothetical protein
MDCEGPIGEATLSEVLYWQQIYNEIVALEEKIPTSTRSGMSSCVWVHH